MIRRKTKIHEIPAEKMALLAEKGLKNARLSPAEMRFLAEGGMDELFSIRDSLGTPVPAHDIQMVDAVMAALSSSTAVSTRPASVPHIVIKLINAALKLTDDLYDWQPESPLFAARGDGADRISMYRVAGKNTVHVEIAREGEQWFRIMVRLSDKSGRELHDFETALIQNEKCIESVMVAKNSAASFSCVEPGDYTLKISDKKGEIVSETIRLEQ